MDNPLDGLRDGMSQSVNAVEYGHMTLDLSWEFLGAVARLLAEADEQPMADAQCGRCGADWAFRCGGGIPVGQTSR